MIFDPTYLMILVVAVVLGAGTQWFVRSSYKRYRKVPLASNMTGAEVARRMLDSEGLHDVTIEAVGGELSDHYDPRAKALRLSRDVYSGRSVASASIAAHEAGHAAQHAKAFFFARARQFIVPAANVASQAAWPLIFLGLILGVSGLVTVGAVAYGVAVFFQVVTLPVEFDASRRAMASLGPQGLVPEEQLAGARRVLTAAALTYVAATLISVMYLLYFIGLGRR